MKLESKAKGALATRQDVIELACLDDSAGLLLGLCAPADVPPCDVDPALREADPTATVEVHAFARVPARPDLVVIGLARADADVAHLQAWLLEVAERVARTV